MEPILITLVVALVSGIGIGTIVRIRFRNSTFVRIHKHVTFVIIILILSFSLFWHLDLTMWTMTIIPLVSLFFIFIVVRNAISKLLEVS